MWIYYIILLMNEYTVIMGWDRDDRGIFHGSIDVSGTIFDRRC